MASPTDQFAAAFRQLRATVAKMAAERDTMLELVKGSRSITQEIDSIPGRRIFFTESGSVNFTVDDMGQRGTPVNFTFSQDGPFVMTHYPCVGWFPSAPSTATTFGQWSPVGSWPLPTQQNTSLNRVDIEYEFVDGGSQRNFQNAAVGQVLSRPDNLIPLPVPTLLSPNTVVQFFPTYLSVLFDGAAEVPTTGGTLVVSLPGYKICNL